MRARARLRGMGGVAVRIQIKRVYDSPAESDGMRVLVDRLWPRGVRKADLPFDRWSKGLAPTTEARRAFAHKADRFGEFRERYLAELDGSEEAAAEVRAIQEAAPQTLTLLYAARDPHVNHAIVLKEWLERRLGAGERSGEDGA